VFASFKNPNAVALFRASLGRIGRKLKVSLRENFQESLDDGNALPAASRGFMPIDAKKTGTRRFQTMVKSSR
jgi:hypothetical protein